MAQRVTLRKRQPYNTKSNRRRQVKTPGGKLVYHHLKKPGTSPKCGDCGISLPGVSIGCSGLIGVNTEINDIVHDIQLPRSLLCVRGNTHLSRSARKL